MAGFFKKYKTPLLIGAGLAAGAVTGGLAAGAVAPTIGGATAGGTGLASGLTFGTSLGTAGATTGASTAALASGALSGAATGAGLGGTAASLIPEKVKREVMPQQQEQFRPIQPGAVSRRLGVGAPNPDFQVIKQAAASLKYLPPELIPLAGPPLLQAGAMLSLNEIPRKA